MSIHIKRNWNYYLTAFFGVLAILFILIGASQKMDLNAATLSKGTTFTTNQTVQYYDLNNLVDLATISGITSSEITDGTIVQGDMSNNSIGTAQIIDATIVTGDVATRTLLGTNIATNTVDGVNLATNITFSAGFLAYTNINTFLNYTNATVGFSTNQIGSGMVNGTSVSAGAGDAGKVVRLNASGLVDSTMTPFSTSFTSTNIAIVASSTTTQTHNLGGMPSLVQARLICTSADNNYSVNDEVITYCNSGESGNARGVSVVPTATTLVIRFGSSANTFTILDKTTGNAGTFDNTKWVFVIRAWK